MSLAWSDERYVRLYSRDTADWLALSWQARGLLALLLRAVDRSGVLGLGKAGREGVAMILRAPWGELAGPLEELLADGCVLLRDDGRELVVRNFVTAQNAPASDKVRQAAARERRNGGTPSHTESRAVTESHAPSRHVTEENPVISALSHAPSRAVTPSHAASLPSESAHLNQPNREEDQTRGLSAKPPGDPDLAPWERPEVEPANKSALVAFLAVDFIRALDAASCRTWGALRVFPEEAAALEWFYADGLAHGATWATFPAMARQAMDFWVESVEAKFISPKPTAYQRWANRLEMAAQQRDRSDGPVLPGLVAGGRNRR